MVLESIFCSVDLFVTGARLLELSFSSIDKNIRSSSLLEGATKVFRIGDLLTSSSSLSVLAIGSGFATFARM